MELRKVAAAFVAGCKDGNELENLDALYAEDAVSIESRGSDERPRKAFGRDAIRDKHVWWCESFETHEIDVKGPFFHCPDRFAVVFRFDATRLATLRRDVFEVLAIYTVAEGKIVREEFFSTSQGVL